MRGYGQYLIKHKMKYTAKRIKDGKDIVGSLIVFDNQVKTADEYNKNHYRGLTGSFIIENQEMNIDCCLGDGYKMCNIFIPVIPDTIEPYCP